MADETTTTTDATSTTDSTSTTTSTTYSTGSSMWIKVLSVVSTVAAGIGGFLSASSFTASWVAYTVSGLTLLTVLAAGAKADLDDDGKINWSTAWFDVSWLKTWYSNIKSKSNTTTYTKSE